MSEEKVNIKKKKKKRSLVYLILMALLLLIALFLVFLLTFPPLQQKAVDLAFNRINDRIEGEFSVDQVNFNMFAGIEFNGLLIKDHHADTLLHIQSFNTGFAQGLRSLFAKKLFLNKLNVKDAKLSIITYKGEENNNLNQLLQSLANNNKPNTESEVDSAEVFDLAIQRLNLEESEVLIEDQNVGTKQHIILAKANANIESFDIQQKLLSLDDVNIDRPEVFISKYLQTSNNDVKPKEAPEAPSKPKPDQPIENWKIQVAELKIKDGNLSNMLINANQSVSKQHFDPNNFNLSKVNIELDSIETDLQLNHSSQRLETEFVLNNQSVPYVIQSESTIFTDRTLSLQSLNVQSAKSLVKQDVTLKYYGLEDFQSFAKYVNIRAEIEPSSVDLSELIYFIPSLANTSFFNDNKTEKIKVSGDFKGRIESFNISDLDLSLGDKIALNSDVSIKNITDIDNAFLVLNINEGRTSIAELKELIPGFVLPSEFNKLGQIDYTGRFSGFVYDFVSFGQLNTELGYADLDLRLDTKGGRNNARYSGRMDLFDFDMKRWTGDDRFGKLTMNSSIKNGQGLSLDLLKSDLEANIVSLDFNDYLYQDVSLNGIFEKRAFNGIFNIDNEAISMDFDGQFVVTDSLNFETDLTAQVKEIDLQKLNLSKEPIVLKGAFDLEVEGNSILNIVGTADVDNLYFLYKDKEYRTDSLFLSSSPGIDGRRSIFFSSDIANFIIEGKINFNELPQQINYIVRKNFPSWVEILNLPNQTPAGSLQDFSYKLEINDSKEFLDLFEVPCLHVEGFTSTGTFVSDEDELFSENYFDLIECNNFKAEGIDFTTNYLNGRLKSSLRLDKYTLGENEFPMLDAYIRTKDEMVNLQIKTANVLDDPGKIDVEILAIAENDSLKFNIEENNWSMLAADWFFDNKNEIIISNEFIDVKHFNLSDGYRNVSLEDLNNEGLSLAIENVDLEILNPYLNLNEFDFSGEVDLTAKVNNIFKDQRTWLEIETESLYLNDFYYGNLIINTATDNFEQFTGNIINKRNEDGLQVVGNFDLDIQRKWVDAYVKASDFDLNFLEFIIKDGIEDTWGLCNIEGSFTGPFDDLSINGSVFVPNGGTTVIYLNNSIVIKNQTAYITENQVNLNNAEIIDEEGNVALVQGGLTHRFFKEFEADVRLTSDRFIGLNTSIIENPDYYGFAIGKFDVEILGPFERVNMNIEATTASGSELNIPVNTSTGNYDESFITFIEKEDLIRGPKQLNVPTNFELEGINLNMNLTLTPEANVNIIFDAELNDVIKANGRGDLAITIRRTGEFDVFGAYEINRGNYLFTALGGAVSKPFIVESGSLISWTGDPINADINIKANLAGLRTPLNIFLGEYITTAGADVQAEANKSTDVDLGMQLTGTLYNPEVSFDIAFPEVTGELANFVNTRISTLKENEADLNNQVAALLLFQSFVPEENLVQYLTANNLAQTGINSLSDFLSGQLSYYVSGFLNDILSDDSYITGIDFQVGFNDSFDGTNVQGSGVSILPDEVEVHVKPQFQGGKWGFDVGTNYVRNSRYFNTQGYVVGDFTVDYFITDDRRLKLRIYGKYDLDAFEDPTNPQRVQKYGLGLTYRREFGNMLDLKNDLKARN